MSEPTIDDVILALPLDEKVPVAALKKLLDQRLEIDERQEQGIQQVRLKYKRLVQPLLKRASQIIRGNPIKQAEITGSHLYMKPNEIKPNYLKGKVIEDYWNSVLSNSALVDQVSEKDEQAVKYLIDIQVLPTDKDNTNNISLKFIFKENPFFKETEVVKHLRTEHARPACIEGDMLTWREGKTLTHECKKVTNKQTGESKIVNGKKINSFFDIFLNWQTEQAEELERISGIFTELAIMILPDSLDYFLGVVEVPENDEDEDDDDDLEDDDEEENSKKAK